VLLARADRGRPVLKEELDQIADVVQVAVYRNADVESLPPGLIDHLAEGRIDWITVTSSAIVQRLFDLLPPEARGRIGETTRLASISPVTSEAAARLGWPVAVEARTHTWEGLVQALVDHARSERTGPAPTSEVPGPP
jgi:uroporphyrinogen III methyltransferase/synthase